MLQVDQRNLNTKVYLSQEEYVTLDALIASSLGTKCLTNISPIQTYEVDTKTKKTKIHFHMPLYINIFLGRNK